MIELRYTVKNVLGIHARPAALLAQACTNFKSAVMIECNGNVAAGNNVLQILSLHAGKGSLLKITADGPDEEEAIAKIDNSAPEKSHAIAAVVEARETTNRALLDFYRQIYNDLNKEAHAMTVLEKAASTPGTPVGEVTRMLNRLLGFEEIK